jgi:hypothetical protein
VGEDAAAQRVLGIDTLDAAQIATHFTGTLPEAHDAVVEKSTSVSVGRVGVNEPCRSERERERKEERGKDRCKGRERAEGEGERQREGRGMR